MSPMARTGSVRERSGRFYVRVRITDDARPEVRLFAAKTAAEARELAQWIGDLVDVLVEANRAELAHRIVAEAAHARTARGRRVVEKIVSGIVEGSHLPKTMTFRQFAERWTSGELARVYPDHVRPKDSSDDVSRLRRYVYPIVGSVPVAAFGLADAERVLAAIPAELSSATRRHVAQIVARVLALAAFPVRLIDRSPLPPKFLPGMGRQKAKAFLFPDEDRLLVSSDKVPAAERLAFGVLVREGLRVEELLSSEWWQWDLTRGTFTLDANKTNDPRLWTLRPDVVRAMAAWSRAHGPALPAKAFQRLERPFANVDGNRLAPRLRMRLRAAGVAREELFKTTATRQQIRAHDLRATFVTLALAAGRSETWVADRTGHRSSDMINRYRRQARTVAELGLGYDDLAQLDEALGWGISRGTSADPATSDGEGDAQKGEENHMVPKAGLEPARPLGRRIFNPLGGLEGPPNVASAAGFATVRGSTVPQIPHLSPTLPAPAEALREGTATVTITMVEPAEIEALSVDLRVGQIDGIETAASARRGVRLDGHGGAGVPPVAAADRHSLQTPNEVETPGIRGASSEAKGSEGPGGRRTHPEAGEPLAPLGLSGKPSRGSEVPTPHAVERSRSGRFPVDEARGVLLGLAAARGIEVTS